MAVVVWWLVRQTLNVDALDGAARDRRRRMATARCRMPPVQVGLWRVPRRRHVAVRAAHQRLPHAHAWSDDWTRAEPLPRVLWLNTGVLILASVAMQWTRVAARDGAPTDADEGLCLPRRASPSHFWPGSSGRGSSWTPSGYFIAGQSGATRSSICSPRCTACTCWAACGSGPGRPPRVCAASSSATVRLSVELCTVYWHYLLAGLGWSCSRSCCIPH